MENIYDAIFDFAYHEALNDATLQGAYIKGKDEIEKITKVKDIIHGYVDDIVKGNDYDFYRVEKDVEQILNKHGIKTDINDGDDLREVFCFGNIQKLINMTTKYIFIGCYANEKLRSNFDKCHCPMDSIMLKTVWEEYDKLGNKDSELMKTLDKDNHFSRSVSDVYWSQIGSTESKDKHGVEIYRNFQAMIGELCSRMETFEGRKISPLEYDFITWQKKSKEKT